LPAGAATPQAAPANWKKTIYGLPEMLGKSMKGFSLRGKYLIYIECIRKIT